jgi:hypothetical protein
MLNLAAAAFLIIGSWPESYQAWLAMHGEHDPEFARRVCAAAQARTSAQATPARSRAAAI